MFPLVHYFVNKRIYNSTSPLLILGGMWPDLAAGAGADRDEAHLMGEDFYAWCRQKAPESLDLARGILSHGLNPPCVDYYADEYWPGFGRGWCFVAGRAYLARVEAATRLPEGFVWWKAHNFVEMAYEICTAQLDRDINKEIMAAAKDEAAIGQATSILATYHQLEASRIANIFRQTPQIYAIESTTGPELAVRQKASLAWKPGVGEIKADTDAMARLIEEMSQELQPGYDTFMAELFRRVRPVLEKY